MKLSEEIEQAKEDFMKHGEVIPMFTFYAGEERWIMPFDGGDFNEGAKYNFTKRAMIVNLALGCHAYTFMSEVWLRILPYKKGDKLDSIVENKPDKIEGILFLRVSRDHKEGVFMEIIRQGEKIDLKESKLIEDIDMFEGRFSNLLPPRDMQEKLPEETKEYLKDFIMTQGVLQRG